MRLRNKKNRTPGSSPPMNNQLEFVELLGRRGRRSNSITRFSLPRDVDLDGLPELHRTPFSVAVDTATISPR
jgi:hypothetical protein